MSPLRNYLVISGTYWAFTLTDGALRMLVVLYFYQLGYSPLSIASLFLFYELFGIVTNLLGGLAATRFGLKSTLLVGLTLQIFALLMLTVPTENLTVLYVMGAQALSGIAKDLNKMSAKSSIKQLFPVNAKDNKLFKWVAILTGSKNILKGGQIPAYAITPPGTVGYYADTDLTFDPSAARTLLAEAGYPDGANFPVTEILYNTNEAHRKVAVAIQQMWRENLNLDLQLLNQEWKVYLQTESSGKYQISRAGWIGDYVDPNNFLDLFLCDGGNNRTGWCNEEYDRLILDVAPSMTSHEERLKVFQKAETMLLDDMPIIPIYTYTTVQLVSSSVKNFDPNIMNAASYKDIYLQADE